MLRIAYQVDIKHENVLQIYDRWVFFAKKRFELKKGGKTARTEILAQAVQHGHVAVRSPSQEGEGGFP